MNPQDCIKELHDLSQLDIDATNAYALALKKIDKKEIYEKIEGFRQDHLSHVENLNNLISAYGGTPPEFSPDLKGYLIEAAVALRSITGLKGALNALENSEVLTNKYYAEALEKNPQLPDDSRLILLKNYDDEQRHLAYIRKTLHTLETLSG